MNSSRSKCCQNHANEDREIQAKLDQLKFEHVKMSKACKEFEDKVKREQTRLKQRIEGATDKMYEGQSLRFVVSGLT